MLDQLLKDYQAAVASNDIDAQYALSQRISAARAPVEQAQVDAARDAKRKRAAKRQSPMQRIAHDFIMSNR